MAQQNAKKIKNSNPIELQAATRQAVDEFKPYNAKLDLQQRCDRLYETLNQLFQKAKTTEDKSIILQTISGRFMGKITYPVDPIGYSEFALQELLTHPKLLLLLSEQINALENHGVENTKDPYKVFYQLRHMKTKEGLYPFKDALMTIAITCDKESPLLKDLIDNPHPESFFSLNTATRKKIDHLKPLASAEKLLRSIPSKKGNDASLSLVDQVLTILQDKQTAILTKSSWRFDKALSQHKADALGVLIDQVKQLKNSVEIKGETSTITASVIQDIVKKWENAASKMFNPAERKYLDNAELMNQQRSIYSPFQTEKTDSRSILYTLKLDLDLAEKKEPMDSVDHTINIPRHPQKTPATLTAYAFEPPSKTPTLDAISESDNDEHQDQHIMVNH